MTGEPLQPLLRPNCQSMAGQLSHTFLLWQWIGQKLAHEKYKISPIYMCNATLLCYKWYVGSLFQQYHPSYMYHHHPIIIESSDMLWNWNKLISYSCQIYHYCVGRFFLYWKVRKIGSNPIIVHLELKTTYNLQPFYTALDTMNTIHCIYPAKLKLNEEASYSPTKAMGCQVWSFLAGAVHCRPSLEMLVTLVAEGIVVTAAGADPSGCNSTSRQNPPI